MPSYLIILIIFNLLWSFYLTYLVYKKIVAGSNSQPTSTTVDSTQVEKELAKCVQKMAIIRFNPFDELGGDQSFVLGLLDNSNSGVIITSLHNRDNTRVYAKPIKNGEGDGVALSREEKMVVIKAIKG